MQTEQNNNDLHPVEQSKSPIQMIDDCAKNLTDLINGALKNGFFADAGAVKVMDGSLQQLIFFASRMVAYQEINENQTEIIKSLQASVKELQNPLS